jgi:hypothetical protein
MIKSYPEIRIKYAWLLANATSEPLRKHWDPSQTTRSAEECEEIAQKYREFWLPYENKILRSMTDVIGLEFHANIIDIYVAPWFYAFSDPLVLGVVFDTQEKLVSALTHELLHRLFMDNRTSDDGKTIEEWEKLFGKHEFVTLVHIPVFAMMHAIFIDQINEPALLKYEKLGTKEYKDAWDYVEKNGYKEIIEKLKNSYKN